MGNFVEITLSAHRHLALGFMIIISLSSLSGFMIIISLSSLSVSSYGVFEMPCNQRSRPRARGAKGDCVKEGSTRRIADGLVSKVRQELNKTINVRERVVMASGQLTIWTKAVETGSTGDALSFARLPVPSGPRICARQQTATGCIDIEHRYREIENLRSTCHRCIRCKSLYFQFCRH
jgi:hypothetical protein